VYEVVELLVCALVVRLLRWCCVKLGEIFSTNISSILLRKVSHPVCSQSRNPLVKDRWSKDPGWCCLSSRSDARFPSSATVSWLHPPLISNDCCAMIRWCAWTSEKRSISSSFHAPHFEETVMSFWPSSLRHTVVDGFGHQFVRDSEKDSEMYIGLENKIVKGKKLFFVQTKKVEMYRSKFCQNISTTFNLRIFHSNKLTKTEPFRQCSYPN
jgi:hypothetical protein